MTHLLLLPVLAITLSAASTPPRARTPVPADLSWTAASDRIEVRFTLTNGLFRLLSLRDPQTGRPWTPAAGATCPIRLTIDGHPLDESTRYTLLSAEEAAIPRNGRRWTIVLAPDSFPAEIRWEMEVYGDQPFLRYRYLYRNLGTRPSLVTGADFLSWRFAAPQALRAFYVNQWATPGQVTTGAAQANFEVFEHDLRSAGPVQLYTGSHALHCTWLTLREPDDNGLILGWGLTGRARVAAYYDAAAAELALTGRPEDLSHPVDAGDSFGTPGAFLGVFRDDWDEAGYLTQRFTEVAIAQPLPDDRFPYVIWDSWGHDQDIDEALLRRSAAVARELGVEVFTVDLGWARSMGDWRPDPAKFPSGLRALSDYAHSLGMKFGLHFALVQAESSAPVLRDHPDWLADDNGLR